MIITASHRSGIFRGNHTEKKIKYYLIISSPCSSEVLTSSEHAARLQKSEILEEVEQGGNCCYTLQSVEKVMKKVRRRDAVLF